MPSAINEVGIPALLALLFVPFTSGFLWMIAFSLIVWWGGHFIGSHINCLNDYDVDKLYKNYLTKAVDDIGPQNIKKILWIETILLTFLVVSLTIVLNKPLLIVFWGLGLLLAFGYSCKPVQLKSRTLMNPIALGLVLYIFPMFFSYLLLAKNLHTFSTVIIILFSIQMVPMFFMDEISDYEEDKQCKINNPCVRYGRKKTILMAIVIYVLSAIGVCSYVVFNFKLLNSAHWILFLISTLFFCMSH
jgi:4-hydroxybenzoate polyprenyltransferase